MDDEFDLNLGDDIDDDGDPPRVWDKTLESPGTAFTRSIGDRHGSTVGVCAEPEVAVRALCASDRVVIVASDGVFEFLTMRQCVEIALLYRRPVRRWSCWSSLCEVLQEDGTSVPAPRKSSETVFVSPKSGLDAGTTTTPRPRAGRSSGWRTERG